MAEIVTGLPGPFCSVLSLLLILCLLLLNSADCSSGIGARQVEARWGEPKATKQGSGKELNLMTSRALAHGKGRKSAFNSMASSAMAGKSIQISSLGGGGSGAALKPVTQASASITERMKVFML